MTKQLRILSLAPSALLPGEIGVDLFAGGGGWSEGFQWATGVPPAVAVNHDEHAIAMHTANHPETEHHHEDVFTVDPITATRGRSVGWLHLSPDCFPAGTLVLTSTGYRPIEEIEVGELVLTHRGDWRPVTETMVSSKATRTIRGHGHPGLRVSAEHPFWTVRRFTTRTYRPSEMHHEWSSPDWTPAKDLKKGDYWATPAFVSPLPVPEIKGRGIELDARLWWLVGRYLADGWSRLTDTRAELVICCGNHEADGLQQRFEAWWPRTGARSIAGELHFHRRQTKTETQFAANHRGLVAWLRLHFGHLAHVKQLPGFVYSLPVEYRRALLDGYLSGDGWDSGDFVEATTVSRALAFSIRVLAASLGFVPALYVQSNRDVIQGRKVNVRPSYHLRWRHEVDSDHRQHHETTLHLFTPIREITDDPGVTVVYNLSVEKDESYIAEGIVVHNCTHFSRAKGSKPKSKKIRGLAWVGVKWAAAVRPRIISLENVAEFTTWGPLHQQGSGSGQPNKRQAGTTFRKFVGALQGLGYAVEWRTLKACDFGAPTSRTRLFVIARRDGQPIAWPKATHGPGRSHPYRTAAECIDWSIPVPSIFERKKPLADATLRRIAEGIRRFVLENPRPFIVNLTHGGRLEPIDEPFKTVTAAHRGEKALVTPLITKAHSHGWDRGAGPIAPADRPLGAILTKDGNAIVAPTLIQTGYGERKGQKPRALDLQSPLGTIVAGGAKHAMVAAMLKHYGGVVGQQIEQPLGTVTAKDHHSLLAVHVESMYSNSKGHAADAPLPTVTAQSNHHGLVAAFLTKYYGCDKHGQPLDVPLHTIPSVDRFGLVTIQIDGETYAIVDIGMRMLRPRELARGQGFPDTYVLTGNTTQQVARIGNSVPPHFAQAIVAANLAPIDEAAEVAA